MGTRNIMVRAGADFSGLSSAMKQAQGEAQSFGSKLAETFTKIGEVGRGVKDVFELVAHSVEGLGEFAQQAGELDGRLSSLNKRLGNSANAFLDWGDTVGKSMGLSKQYIIDEGASLSAMLMTQASSTSELATKTETMMKNIAIVSSATGKSQTEVSDMMVSALAGHGAALRSLDLNVMQSSLVHTAAFKQIAGASPWASLTQQQKEAIMYTEINRQVAQKFGTTVVDDVATRMNIFRSSLSDVKTNLEVAFQPILYKVLPILANFIVGLNNALQYVSAFMQVLFGYDGAKINKTTQGLNDQASAVNNLASAHGKLGTAQKTSGAGIGSETLTGGKKLGTGFSASFDQIHTVGEKSPSASGGGAGAGTGVGADANNGMGELVDDGQQTQSAMDKVRQSVAGIVEDLKSKFGELKKFFSDNSLAIGTALAGIGGALAAVFLISNWGEIVGAVTLAMEGLGGALAVLTSPITLTVLAIGGLVAILYYLWNTNKGFRDSVTQVWNEIKDFAKKVFTDMWTAVKNTWDKYGQDIWNNIKGIFDKICNIILDVWNKYVHPILEDGIKRLKDLWDNHLKGLFQVVSDFVGKLIDNALKILNKFILPLISWIVDRLAPIFRYWWGVIAGNVQSAIAIISDVLKTIFKVLGDVTDFITGVFTGNWNQAWQGITNTFSDIWNGIKEIAKEVINGIIDQINGMIDNMNNLSSIVPGWMGGKALTINHIPHLANGGITNGAMLSVIGDNAGGQEVVSPLSKLQDYMASTVAGAIHTAMNFHQGNGNTPQGDIVLNVDGRVLARIVKPFLDKENLRVGQNVRLNTI